MELKDFIKEAIRDISEAIDESNTELYDLDVISNPSAVSVDKREDIYGHTYLNSDSDKTSRPVHLLKFDVAVSATKKDNGEEGIGVKALGITLNKGGETSDELSNSSRLKFSLPIAFPTGRK
ncbi:hypothetical protein [Idiomarina zobellii]|uniref:Uncharacterized protein n=1 Tax=Idiomarina zobellii TaxID=86103 RepID=A0A837NHT4_9GAMM|nr:hypothetical protein [Idiomarina zobellii]KPD24317.1 hypothetical protein AFK76_04820 [Idiomarina zobellii]SDF67012.1 hypothetical protein SAMN04515658_103170 [Idiomarina zobellii]